MATYLLLYSGGGMPEGDAAMKASMDAWDVWSHKVGSSLLDMGKPFTPNAKNISSSGMVSDGPGGLMANGYSIIKANSLDEAAEMAKSSPVIQSGGKISIFETFDIPGM